MYGFKTKFTIGNNGHLNGNETISDLLLKAILFNFSGKVWVRELFYVSKYIRFLFLCQSLHTQTFYVLANKISYFSIHLATLFCFTFKLYL